MIKRLLIVAAPLGLAACTNGQYLVFGSEQVFGAKLALSTTSNEPAKIEIGYASNDLALVPVTKPKPGFPR